MSPTAANASFEYDQCLRTAAFERDCVQTMDNQPVLVTKGIYIGSYRAERNREACQREGITHILQVGVLSTFLWQPIIRVNPVMIRCINERYYIHVYQ